MSDHRAEPPASDGVTPLPGKRRPKAATPDVPRPALSLWNVALGVAIPLLVVGVAGAVYFAVLVAPPARPAKPLANQPPPQMKALPPEQPVRPPIVAGPPIPQDPERQRRRHEDALAWNRATFGGAYDKVGKKDARWDGPARAALEEAARAASRADDPHGRWEAVHPLAAKAVAAGCDDPLVLYLYSCTSFGPRDPGPADRDRRASAAARAMRDSDYAPIRRAIALLEAGELKAGRDGQQEEAARLLDEAVGQVVVSAEKDGPGLHVEDLWFDVVSSAVSARLRLGADHDDALSAVSDRLGKAEKLRPVWLQVKGQALIHHAWDARGSGLADTVPEEGWAKFAERLGEARTVLQEAWEASGHGRVATMMMTVEKGLGRGDRAAMEKWFERAMRADGDNLSACRAKMDWLAPKWHGTVADMLGFGRACRETGNWRAGITLLAAEAHRQARTYVPPDQQFKYFLDKEVQEEVRGVFEEYLKHRPDDRRERAFYGAYLTLSGHWVAADDQFRAASGWPEGDQTSTDARWVRSLRDHAAPRAAQQRAKEAGKIPPRKP